METTETIATLQRAWIDITRRAQLPALEERVRRDSGTNLARPAFVVLARLDEHGPLQVSELASLSGVDISTMSRTLRHLAEEGYVARTRGEDLRCVLMEITDAGRVTAARMRAAGQRMLDDVLAGWSEPDRCELARLMARFSTDFARYAEKSPEAEERP